MTGRRIAVAGCQHETNTFAAMNAPYEEFAKADAWPGLTVGQGLFATMTGKNLPMAGFIDAAKRQPDQILPILWCAAEPSSYVTPDAFERIAGMICEGLRECAPFDAVYLDLHGAMVAEHYEDGEGELLSRVREIIGPDIPLVASLDLHANVTARMVEQADGLTLFRTYPHIDMASTGGRAFGLLQRMLDGVVVCKSFNELPFLIPLSAQCSDFEPNRSIYARLPELGSELLWSADFAAAFPPADIHDCGPAVVVYGSEPGSVDRAAEDLYRFIAAAEPRFDNPLLAPHEAVRQAMEFDGDKPVVLADVQDNPGAGGSSDTVGLLEALLAGDARGAVLAVLNDPESAARARAAGTAATVALKLGGKSGQPGQCLYTGEFEVEKVTDGRFLCTGAMYGGMQADIGPMVLLRAKENREVRVVVGSERMQCLDLAIFRHMGIEPERQNILAIKSTVHFRADFDPIAGLTVYAVLQYRASC